MLADEIRFDNFHVDMLIEGDAALKLAVDLAMFGRRSITHWKILRGFERRDAMRGVTFEPDEKGYLTLVLLWHADTNAIPFPVALSGDTLMAFIRDWVKALQNGDRPQEMEHDGSNHEAIRIFTTQHARVYTCQWSVFVVQAAWAAYGK